ncbi:MAG TPA: GAF domain-containing protein, partial [Terriglobales bacterium]|nr:GAF domain-containing protein [Terriglobales bacterium]
MAARKKRAGKPRKPGRARPAPARARKAAAPAVDPFPGLVRVLADDTDLAQVEHELLATARRLLRARSAALYAADPDGDGGLIFHAADGASELGFARGHRIPPGRGTIGLVVRSRAAVTTPDLLADPRLTIAESTRARLAKGGDLATLAVPLLLHGRVVGVLVVLDRRGRVFSDEEVRLAQTFADHAVLAFEKARVRAEAGAREHEARVLADLMRRLTASIDLETVEAHILEAALSLFDVPTASLFSVEPGTGNLIRGRVAGEGAERARMLVGLTIPPGTGAAGRAIQERAPVTSVDIVADPRLSFPETHRQLMAQAPNRAALAVPLMVDDHVPGVLVFYAPTGRQFTPAEVRLAQTFADHAAVAFEKVRLFREAEARRTELERLYAEAQLREREARALAEIARRLARGADLDGVEGELVSAALDILGARSAVLWRVDPETGALVYRRTHGEVHVEMAPGLVLPPGTGAPGVAVGRREVVLSTDYFTDAMVPQSPTHQAQGGASPNRAVLAAPLVADDRVIAVLAVYDRTGRAFTPRE